MKQSFKIGKIFLLIIVSVCIFLNCNVDCCFNLSHANDVFVYDRRVEDTIGYKIFGFAENVQELQTKFKQQSSKIIKPKAEMDDQQIYEIMTLKNELDRQACEEMWIKIELSKPQSDMTEELQAELDKEFKKAQQQLKDMQSQFDKMIGNSSSVATMPVGQQTQLVSTQEYFPIDISGSIFDSTFVAIKNVDDFNMESEYLNVKVGFNYNFYLKKDEGDDFNKYIILNPKFFGTDSIYFSVFNYHNFLKNRHTNSEDFKKNYYTLYTRSNIDEINSIYFGAGIGYIPFRDIINDSDNNFKKYMLFASLNTDFGVILFNDYIHFSNLFTVDFNLLRSDYLVNSNKSNEYIKLKDAVLLNYEIDNLTGLFIGIDFGVYTMHKKFRKDIGLNKNTECNLITGIKFEFGSINASLGNRGVGLGLNMSY